MKVTPTFARFATLSYDIGKIRKYVDIIDAKINRALELESEARRDETENEVKQHGEN